MSSHVLELVALNTNKLKDLNIHPSFRTILDNKTIGGILLSNVILNLYKENKLGLPLFLTPKGIKASHDLIDMLNSLPTNNNSKFKGDNLLLDYLSKKTNLVIRYNMENTLITIIPIVEYKLPIGYQKVLDGDCSGIYCFISKTSGKYGIGSALSCRKRLNDHINSFNGHRLRSKLHDWILNYGGITMVKWAPIITFDNIVQEWYSINSTSPLSVGGTNILKGFGQYPARILEQCVYTNYKPFLNISNDQDKDIIFFNFSFKLSDMKLDLQSLKTYQAWADKDMTNLISEANSYNSLAQQLGVSVGSVRNNMDWHKGMCITKDGEEVVIYLKEKGVSFRTEQVSSQLYPKTKYPLLNLKNRSLYDLLPGKIYVINVDTFEDFGTYNSQRELWKSLNSSSNHLDNLTMEQQHNFLNNRVGRYINVKKPKGIQTEMGCFYFARHPDYLPNMAKTATGLFAVNTLSGLAIYFPNNSKAGNRGTVRRFIFL